MRDVLVLTVGKPREAALREMSERWLKLAGRAFRAELAWVKDADAGLPEAERKAREGRTILEKAGRLGAGTLLVCLDEGGERWGSGEFARRLSNWRESGSGKVVFVVGGAFGLSPEVLGAAAARLSLGPMTLPHELALAVLCEQVWRAASIHMGISYHHG